jgi:hypothetical protein
MNENRLHDFAMAFVMQATKILTKDVARRIAAHIAKLSELVQKR